MDTASLMGSRPLSLEPFAGDPRNFINRELSTLAFLERVLEEASDPELPLLERLRFLSVLSVGLDEFFMIRVAGLKQQLSGHVEETGPDAMTPAEQFQAVSKRCHALIDRQDRVFREEVVPGLERVGVRLFKANDLPEESRPAVADYFQRQVLPVLTPLALDPAHPFPHLRNKSLNLVIRFAARPGARVGYGVVPVPGLLPRLVQVPGGTLLLEDVIALHLAPLFPETPIEGCWAFRVTRNWDLNIDEEEAEDLLVTIEREVRRRDRGSAVRLQINASPEEPTSRFLARALNLAEADVYHQNRPLAISELFGSLMARPELKHLQDESFTPVIPAALGVGGADLFEAISAGDVLLHHPYESFESVVSFVESAADDPDVLAVKMTLYRAGQGSPIVRALQRAAENGKQVTALVELKARMDEEANILWARELEQAGVHVVYGLIGFKTHCKLALVVRSEGGKIRRYVHLGTGNYNTGTARAYSDLSLFTAQEDFAADATALFNLLTGYSKPPRWRKFLVSPLGLKQSVLQLIEDEIRAGPDGRIVAKMNALADTDVIRALYRASQLLAPGHRRRERADPRHLGGGPVPGARADLAFPRPGREEGLPRLRRLDAAQLHPPRRRRVPGGIARGQGAHPQRDPRHDDGGQRQGADPPAGRHLRAHPSGEPRERDHAAEEPGALHGHGPPFRLRGRLSLAGHRASPLSAADGDERTRARLTDMPSRIS